MKARGALPVYMLSPVATITMIRNPIFLSPWHLLSFGGSLLLLSIYLFLLNGFWSFILFKFSTCPVQREICLLL